MAAEMMPQLMRMRAIHRRAHVPQHQVAGHLEEKIAEKEDAHARAVDLGAQLKIIQELQAGKADVGPIENVEDVEQEQEGQQPQGHRPQRRAFDRGTGRGRVHRRVVPVRCRRLEGMPVSIEYRV